MADVYTAETLARLILERNSGKEIVNLPFHPEKAAFTEYQSGKITLAATANTNLGLGSITTVRRLWLTVNKDCTVKYDGNGVGASFEGTKVLVFLVGCNLSAINVTNDDVADAADVAYVVTD